MPLLVGLARHFQKLSWAIDVDFAGHGLLVIGSYDESSVFALL